MDNVKDDRYYTNKMIDDLQFITRHMTGVDQGRFNADELLQTSMMFQLIQLSENARKLTEGFRDAHDNIPWGDVFGLRNRIVHEYGGVDLSIVYDTLTIDIPDLLEKLSTVQTH